MLTVSPSGIAPKANVEQVYVLLAGRHENQEDVRCSPAQFTTCLQAMSYTSPLFTDLG